MMDSRREEAYSAALEAAEWAQRRISSGTTTMRQVGEKSGPGDWVTSADREIESGVKAMLRRRFPDDTVIGEESGVSARPGSPGAPEGLTWYIDPIDGTTNYVHGLPGPSVSVAAVDAEGPVVGVVYDIYRDEVFSAARGEGMLLDRGPYAPPQTVGLRGGLFLTECSGQAPWPGMSALMEALGARFTATRILGSCALALASVAAGRATAAVLGGYYNIWDVAAGALIAREGGRVLFSVDGEVDHLPMRGLGVAEPSTWETVRDAWASALAGAQGGAHASQSPDLGGREIGSIPLLFQSPETSWREDHS